MSGQRSPSLQLTQSAAVDGLVETSMVPSVQPQPKTSLTPRSKVVVPFGQRLHVSFQGWEGPCKSQNKRSPGPVCMRLFKLIEKKIQNGWEMLGGYALPSLVHPDKTPRHKAGTQLWTLQPLKCQEGRGHRPLLRLQAGGCLLDTADKCMSCLHHLSKERSACQEDKHDRWWPVRDW